MRLVVSIDSSTTACKAIAWDERGHVQAEGRAAYPLLRPQPAWAEQDAEDWWTSACAALRACLGEIEVCQVEALGITHQRESFVPVDGEGRPLRHAILWLDERSRTQLEWLDRAFGSDALHDLTGKPPSMTQSLPKIVWLLQNEPETVRRAARFLDVHAFLVHRLTGRYVTSLASADPLGLVDMRRGEWAGGLMRDLGLRPEQFVPLVAPGTVIGGVSAQAASATGLPHGLPVVAGAGDGQCAGLGANALGAGAHGTRAYLNLGTGIAAGVMSETYRADRAFRTLCAPLSGAFFFEHILRGGTYTVSWFVEKFAADLAGTSAAHRAPQEESPGHRGIPGLRAEEILEAAAAQVPPGASGLMLVPYWNSVMSPYWDPAATGVTVGWTGKHGREHFYRAILEGIAFEQRLVGDAMMDAAGERFSEYVTMGGGSRSALWRQILADVTGVAVLRSTATEATCLGAGILAAVGAGWYGDARAAAQAMTSAGERHDPEPQAQAVYDTLYREVYQPLYPALRSLLDRLAELAHSAA